MNWLVTVIGQERNLYMFSPEYFRQTSLLNGKENLMGNLEAAGLIENMAFECIKNDIDLYTAQEQIKTKHGINYQGNRIYQGRSL